MNADERREKITRLVNRNGEVSFAEIKAVLPDVSDMTVRRDLEFLGQSNKIVRVFGGAKSVDYLVGVSEAGYAKRSIEQAEGKAQIARKAVQLLKEDTAVFLGSGTTTAQFAKLFPNGKYFVTTTGLNCAIDLSALPDVSLMMLGGSVNKNSFCVNGTIADKMIADMHFNIAFLGVGGYLPGKGFTTSVIEDYILRQTIVKNSDTTAILMDSTKFGRTGVSTFTFAAPEMIRYVISDDALPFKAREEFESHGITVL